MNKIMKELNLKRLSKTEWEGKTKQIDYHITQDKSVGGFVIDVFDNKVKDADKAHLDSFGCISWKDVKETLKGARRI